MDKPTFDEAAIFNAARRIKDPVARRRYVRETCGAPALADRVEALLRAHGEDATFLADPAEEVRDLLSASAAEGPGTQIGPYKLLRLVGAGGMGTVFVAEQTRPVHRQVALKVIRPGMDSRLILARFEAERQALALMDHPNIARVLDAGTMANNRPYFVMELIVGVPLLDYCDREGLSVRRRLELFVPVCQAVQHAHQKGVMHRDLKPSNVLLAVYDGRPVPKIIDFGLAKTTDTRLTEQTLVTEFGTVIGTWEYMSPEQADPQHVDIDTRTDIYSLGVLLYELLTGSTPLGAKGLRGVSLWELLRHVREADPPRPSARLEAIKGLDEVAAQRGVEPKKLVRLVRGDLDWIVMKCLEKDRTRRYQTANGLARDIERYLNEEPVEACPPSAGYQLWKFARKYRRILATAGAFVLLLALATLASTWQAIRATLAETNAHQARKVAQEERQQAVTNLYHALVEEAEALRRARGKDYRTVVFNRLQQALLLDTPDKDIDRLRDEAVACLGDFAGLQPMILDDFQAEIRKVALTEDGEQMAIALNDGTIQLRDVRTGGVVARLRESVVDLAMDPDNRWLVTAGVKGTIKVWPDYGTGPAPAAQIIEMRGDFAGMSRNGRFALGYSRGKEGGSLSLWDVARREVKARLKVPAEEPAGTPQVSDDGQWVAQASRGATNLYALVWNTPVPQPKKIFLAKTSQDTSALSISPHGSFLACQHGDDGIILLDVREGVPRPRIRSDEVLAACFSPDGRFLLYYSIGGHVGLWSVSHHQEVATLAHRKKGGQDEAYLTAFSGDGNTFATALRVSRSICIWKLAGTGEKLALAGHEGGVPCVAFSPDGKVLASGSKDHLVKLWDTTTGRLLRNPLPRFDSPIQSLAFSPDGHLLATGQFGPTPRPVQIWDLATRQAFVPPNDELGQAAYGVAFSPDGKIVAACGNGLTLWRLTQGKKGAADAPHLSFKRMAHLPGRRSLCLCISPNGKLLAWVDRNYLVRLWDLANEREVPFQGPLLAHGWHNIASYPDSDHLTFGVAGGMVETWDIRTARRVAQFGKVGHVATSPDGRWLATTGPVLWSSRPGSRVFSFLQESGPIWSLAVSPGGERLAFGQADGTLAIWNVPRIQAQLTPIGLGWDADARSSE